MTAANQAPDDSERELREQMAARGRSLFERRFTHGSTGNLSVRLNDGILVTPTDSSLGSLAPDRIAKVSFDGEHLAGDRPSKEAFLHLSMYRSRPQEFAVVHLHSTYSVAVSCMAEIDPENVLPPITAYQLMRVGRCPLVPFYAPGDMELAAAVGEQAKTTRAMLLANHGPVIAGKSLAAAVAAAEELEETARLFLLLRGIPTRLVPDFHP
ncbi:L-fuculose phosphate aldolase [Rubripirellula lacrimiformis]|uniref:3-oxo-tetronate 4-phosphate decarboxylase n=1 Tax=Rubripirellula lacrimiformis TaxID=1930273 RepID=A0A517NKL7_9BACT|nr:3-oxo-tetronate 4-phosphate decarboxylase [Rubripirellula lacrimiformis]QDT07684.1 L-fuculose phosphate aldolase [Rubripirellula lacrimiformis]